MSEKAGSRTSTFVARGMAEALNNNKNNAQE